MLKINYRYWFFVIKKKFRMIGQYPISITQALKWGIFAAFAILFIGNNAFIEALAVKIDRELITPYRNSTMPFSTLVEVTETAMPQLAEERFSLDPTPTKPPLPTKNPAPTGRTVSEDELWQAFASYRKTHGKKEISRSDKLCQYARKRANELSDRLKTSPEDPLDAHAGFQRDADSGYVFEFTGFSQVGENLAYTPAFTTGTQVIEWGWDTSSGHRSLQLSDDITHGCLSGIHPVYVGIFGN